MQLSRKKPRKNLSPKMVGYFPSQAGPAKINPTAHMFQEDIHLGIMPITGFSQKRKDFTASLSGGSTECERARHLIESINRYDKHTDTELLSDAITEIARNMVWTGSAAFEIVSDEHQTELHTFTTKNLIRLPGWYLQIVPLSDQHFLKKRYSLLPASHFWNIKMPGSLGGQREFKRTLSALTQFDKIGPAFWRENLENGNLSQEFSFQDYNHDTEIFIRQKTKTWGWNARDLSQEHSTEFYWIYKKITFRWAQSILRDHIVQELNALMTRLTFGCRVSIEGLPTPEEILRARRGLIDGSVSFDGALKFASPS